MVRVGEFTFLSTLRDGLTPLHTHDTRTIQNVTRPIRGGPVPIIQVQTAIFIWENRGNGSIKVRLDVLAKTSQWGVVGAKSP